MHDLTEDDRARLLDEALKLIDKQRDYDALAQAINERVLRTPEPTPKQETLMEEFADEMPVWAQLAFVQSENERMREELRQALRRGAPEHPSVADLRKLAEQTSGDQGLVVKFTREEVEALQRRERLNDEDQNWGEAESRGIAKLRAALSDSTDNQQED